ncbi:MAG: ATP-binding cassette domain-containing protein [Caldisericota bacterium]|nr:ATP-binding cassette domain-containing protein [Caldisericota bacterium]
MNDAIAIHVQDLHYSYGAICAVDGIDFDVRRGEIFSLLGPNGAGKTTTIGILSCLLRPSSGTATIMGHSVTEDANAVKGVIGVVPQDIALYADLSARENLVFWGKMQGMRGAALAKRVDEIVELIGLGDRQRSRISTYSGGMKRRVNIGVALLHKPALVIMDEPTVGIDPQSRRAILDNVMHLRDEGTTVLYTTHYMEEAEELSDHVGIMDHGRIIALGTRQELIKSVGGLDRVQLHISAANEDLLQRWRLLEGVTEVTTDGDVVTVMAADSNRILPRLFETASEVAVRIVSANIQEPNLEAVFLRLTGRALRD